MHIISKRGSADNVLTYEHICDTTADMATIEPKYITLGSVCIVLQGSSGAMEVYMASSNKQWCDIMTVSSGSSSGGGEAAGLSLYICTQAEVSNGRPNVSTPTEGVLYLVPSGNTSGDLYNEYVYINNDWELFGGASINLEGYATQDWVSQQGYLTSHQDISGKANSADLALKANKTDTILETTLSRGRKENTTVGGASLAFGIDTEASGYYSVALGLNTTASSQGAYAEGKNTVAHYIAHAEGEDSQALSSWSHAQNLNTIARGGASSASGRHTIANGADSFVFGRYNAADSYDNWPTWVANTSYKVGDRIKRNLMVQNEPTDVGYHCTVANSDATFNSDHWELDGYHMNYVQIVGNGKEYEDPETHQSVRAGSNAYALEWNGTAHYAGNVYVGANPDSTGGVKLATVNEIPTKVSDLTDDSGHYTKPAGGIPAADLAETYATQTYVNNALAAVDTLPAPVESGTGIGSVQSKQFTITIDDEDEVYVQSASGEGTTAFGANTNASTFAATAIGAFTTASGECSFAEGDSTKAIGDASHAEGSQETKAIGFSSHAEGINSYASGRGAHSEGGYTRAMGAYSHSEGNTTVALGDQSHAEGYGETFYGTISSHPSTNVYGLLALSADVCKGCTVRLFTEDGMPDDQTYTIVSVDYINEQITLNADPFDIDDIVLIENNVAIGNASHTEGSFTIAAGNFSHTEGDHTIANGVAQHVQGKYNVEDTSGTYAHIVGNGTTNSNRSNAYVLDWNGNGHYAGDIYVNANSDSTGGVKVATINAIPTLVSQLTNDSGYLTSFTETDPTVPSWAKAAQKPTYTAQEVGALPANTVIPTVPTNVSSFTNDAGYVTENDITATLQEESATQIAAIEAKGEEILTSVKMLRYDIAEYDSKQTGKMFFKNTEALATVSNGYVKKYTIEPNVTYYFSSSGRASDSGFYFINYFDSNDTYLSSEYGIHSAGEDHDFTVLNIPNNAAWFYANGRAEEPEVYIDSTPNKSLAQVIQEVNKLNNKELKTISILFVGNSLTQDSIAYLPYMLVNYYPEVDFKFYIWYNGGYTLAQQYAKFTGDTACESFSIAENTANWTTSTAKMSDVLTTYEFDIVCLQEYFNYKESYVEADLADWNNCRDYIQSHYTGGNALKFISLLHAPLRSSAETVYSLTKTGNALILQKTIAEDIIPVGIAIHRALSTTLDSLGDSGHLSPDGTHTQEGLPCLLQTYVVLQWVLDKLSIPKSIYGSPMRMTAEIYASINVPGANLGTGLIAGTDAQNLLAQEVAIQAYKEGKWFVMQNLYNAN